MHEIYKIKILLFDFIERKNKIFILVDWMNLIG
jgi:hypothetical protein